MADITADLPTQLAERFVSEWKQIARVQGLELPDLDWSIESLEWLEDYLYAVHNSASASEHDLTYYDVSRIGSYVGEVIRRNVAPEFYWHTHKEWAARQPEQTEARNDEPDKTKLFVLGHEDYGFCFPIGKVVKFLDNGYEDSVRGLVSLAKFVRAKKSTEQEEV